MNDYSFNTLNDKEFETLCTDLISVHFNTKVDRFKPGKDGGIDGRFFLADDLVVIQCKHWLKSGVRKLISNLKKEELKKVKKINPKRYIFMTSLDLSPQDKSEIALIFKGYILSEFDIFSRENLNDILSLFPEIEQRHYKLWLSSTTVLRIILNSGIIGRSSHTIKSIQRDLPLYVETLNHISAINRLDKLHNLIITGAPGVGKTTLANQICFHYTAKGYEFVFIESSVEEAEKVYDEKKKQIFYFDDFLGRNHLMALELHQDSKIVRFIGRVREDKKKKFVLTSRTNIINQGKGLSDLFDIEKIDRNEYELTISSLRKIDKARILYNHIWCGHLKEPFIEELYKNRRYHKIINHERFNPRLISFITDSDRLLDTKAEDYWDFVNGNLQSPKEVWRNVIEVQLDDECRHIVIAFVLNYKEISEPELKRIIRNMMTNIPSYDNSKSINSTLKVLTGALVNRNSDKTNVTYNLFDPSIGDFVISNYLDNVNYISQIVDSLGTISSIQYLNQLRFADHITKNDLSSIHRFIFQKRIQAGELDLEREFDVILMREVIINEIYSGNSKQAIQSLLVEFIEEIEILTLAQMELCYLAMRFDLFDKSSNKFISCLRKSIEECEFTYEELKEIEDLIFEITDEGQELIQLYKDKIIDSYHSSLTQMIIDDGYCDNLIYYETPSHSHDIGVELNEEALYNYVEKKLEMFKINFSEEDIENIMEACDFDKIYDYHIEMNEPYYEDDRHEHSSYLDDNDSIIDDLFDRS